MLLSGKKGVSPLVATVLLVLFSILLGVAVMSWSEGFIKKNAVFVNQSVQKKVGCSAASFSLVSLKHLLQICVRDSTIEATIENGPDAELFDIHAVIVGSKDVVVAGSVLPRPLPPAYAMKVVFGIDSVGEVLQVKFVPKIKVDGTVVYCTTSAQFFENIPNCA